MFNRITLKSRAKAVLSLHYWPTFLALFLAGLITQAASIFTNLFSEQSPLIINESGYIPTAMLLAFASTMLLIIIISFCFTVFVAGPMYVGTKKFLLNTSLENNPDISAIFHGFKSGYKTIATTTLMKQFVFLTFALIPVAAMIVWMGLMVAFESIVSSSPLTLISLPLVIILSLIPYMMKYYDYYLTDYILAENPDMQWRDVLKKSKEMMRGNRWMTFVMHLSFIGWILLGICAFFVGVLFVDPYIQATDTQLYLELSGKNEPETESYTVDL